MEQKPRLRLLGAEVDVVTPAEVMAFTAACVAQRRRAVVANHNSHSLHLVRKDPVMRALYERADLIEIDSVPMILWGRLLGAKVSRKHRCTYLDWREDFWRLARRHGWRVYHLGGEPGVGDRAQAAIEARFPGVSLRTHHGFFDPSGPENEAVLADIAAFGPNVLFVGMGMPRQEAWIAANLDRLPGAVIFPLGAAFDFEAGAQMTPPRWTGRFGVEWLYRFLSQPKRLFGRYFVEPWSLLPLALADVRAALAPSTAVPAVPLPRFSGEES